MTIQTELFAEALAEICAYSTVAPGRPLRWAVIANPKARGFVIRSRWKKCQQVLEVCRAAARKNPPRKDCISAGTAVNGLFTTQGPGDAADITQTLLAEAASALHNTKPGQTGPFYLIITAGGDGTSLEVQSALYHSPRTVRENMAIIRLPMGTGNDGADAPVIADALELLLKPSRVEFSPALRLITAPGGSAACLAESQGPFLAFNILSVGLDAFVTRMTNKMKEKFPGDFYKLWVDIASLLYDRIYTVGFLYVRAMDGQGSEVRSFREKILLLAVGASGHRTYGSRKKILPDDRNVCALRQMPLLRKLALKGLFSTGAHVNKPEAIMFNARRVEITGEHPVLAQMDGEAVLLRREDFPVTIELVDSVIPVLRNPG